MADVACPNCRGIMSSGPELAGKWVACPFCHQQFVLPQQKAILQPTTMMTHTGQVYSVPQGGSQASSTDVLAGIRTPILISGIINAIAAVIYIIPCITIFITVPLAILCVFEFQYYSNAPRMPLVQAIREGRTLAIYEIVAGALTLNIIVLVCGILALVMANQAQERYAQSPAVY